MYRSFKPDCYHTMVFEECGTAASSSSPMLVSGYATPNDVPHNDT
jgi:hypothetical protein